MSQALNLEPNPTIAFFTDFDGTITQKDSNDLLIANLGFGEEMLKASDLSVLEGKKSFREAFVEQMHSIDGTLEECAEYQRKYADLDIGFAEFYRWARASAIPVVVLSAGLQPLIRALIARLLGPEAAAEIEIISNEVVAWEDTKGTTRRDWQVKLHDGTEFGMDKSVHIEAYKNKLLCMPDAERPILLFAGDGVSDLSAAKSADLLFAKAGKDLITYCEREEISFVTFEDWRNILEATKRIYASEHARISA